MGVVFSLLGGLTSERGSGGAVLRSASAWVAVMVLQTDEFYRLDRTGGLLLLQYPSDIGGELMVLEQFIGFRADTIAQVERQLIALRLTLKARTSRSC